MNKYFLLLGFLFTAFSVSAQHLTVNGNVVIGEDSPEGASLLLIKNGNKIDEQVLNKKGRFEVKLAFDADYKLFFKKAGYISKLVNINTEVPEESIEANPDFPPVKLIINLLPSVQDVDLSIFEQPIAILSYNAELDDFTFDQSYSDKIKDRIAQTEQLVRRKFASQGAAALAEAKRSVEQQNEQTYKLLIAAADSLFSRKQYVPAKEKYASATQVKTQEAYPKDQIRKIDHLLAEIDKQEAARQKQMAETETAYQKAIAQADQSYQSQQYEQAIQSYRQAITLKPRETYPHNMIDKSEKALADLAQRQAAEAEKQKREAERINALKSKYAAMIAEADQAFKTENYSLAKIRYTEADQLYLGEEYPRKQLQEIARIINSSKYKARLAEYNKYKTLAEKNLEQQNYASAKVYFQKALSVSIAEQDAINRQIAKIDRLIEAEQLAALEKEYQEVIRKADKAYEEKAFAVAKFYYQKALEVKSGDKHASERLEEVKRNMGERQTKEAEL